jgi:hypothetical protein
MDAYSLDKVPELCATSQKTSSLATLAIGCWAERVQPSSIFSGRLSRSYACSYIRFLMNDLAIGC